MAKNLLILKKDTLQNRKKNRKKSHSNILSKSGIESAIDFAMVGKYPDLRELQTVSRLDKRHCSSSKCKNLNLFSLLVHS